MTNIIFSLRHASQGEGFDLEVSGDQSIRECVDFVALREGWVTPNLLSSLAYSVEARSGHYLPLDYTFQQANVRDGADLIFHPPGRPPQASSPNKPEEPRHKTQGNNGYKMIQLD